MPTTVTIVTTEHGSRYLQQLCKHWSHKFETTFDPARGTVTMPEARLELEAGANDLRLELESANAEGLPHLCDVVAEHIRRFAFREELVFDWHPKADA